MWPDHMHETCMSCYTVVMVGCLLDPLLVQVSEVWHMVPPEVGECVTSCKLTMIPQFQHCVQLFSNHSATINQHGGMTAG